MRLSEPFFLMLLLVSCVSQTENPEVVPDQRVELFPFSDSGSEPNAPQNVLDEYVFSQLKKANAKIELLITPEYMRAYAIAAKRLEELSETADDIGSPAEYLMT